MGKKGVNNCKEISVTGKMRRVKQILHLPQKCMPFAKSKNCWVLLEVESFITSKKTISFSKTLSHRVHWLMITIRYEE
jgi:hypothetical protein